MKYILLFVFVAIVMLSIFRVWEYSTLNSNYEIVESAVIRTTDSVSFFKAGANDILESRQYKESICRLYAASIRGGDDTYIAEKHFRKNAEDEIFYFF